MLKKTSWSRRRQKACHLWFPTADPKYVIRHSFPRVGKVLRSRKPLNARLCRIADCNAPAQNHVTTKTMSADNCTTYMYDFTSLTEVTPMKEIVVVVRSKRSRCETTTRGLHMFTSKEEGIDWRADVCFASVAACFGALNHWERWSSLICRKYISWLKLCKKKIT